MKKDSYYQDQVALHCCRDPELNKEALSHQSLVWVENYNRVVRRTVFFSGGKNPMRVGGHTKSKFSLAENSQIDLDFFGRGGGRRILGIILTCQSSTRDHWDDFPF